MGASVRNHTESEMAKLLMLLLLPSLILADGPGGHHHGAHHGDHGAHHGAHNENHAHAGGAVHHGYHGASHHPVQHTLQSSPVQHHTVHSSVQRPVSASFSIQPEAHPIQHSVSQGPQDLAQLVATHPKLTTLYAAVKAAGLEATLASPGPFTVFAPTNLAFKKIPDADLQRLLGDKAAGQEHPTGCDQPKDSCRGANLSHEGQVYPGQVKGGKRFYCSIRRDRQQRSSSCSRYRLLDFFQFGSHLF